MDNRFAFKKLKPRIIWITILTFGFLTILIISFIFLKFSIASNYEGTYYCQKEKCFISSYMLVDDIKKLNLDFKLIINKDINDLVISSIGDVELINNVAVQKIIINVKKQNFYNYQTISYSILKQKQNIWQILWHNLKGGDAYINS